MSIPEQTNKDNAKVDSIIKKFPFVEVLRIMKQLGLFFIDPETDIPYIPTLKQLQEHCTLLLDSVACSSQTNYSLQTRYFAAIKNGHTITLLFVPYCESA